MIKRLLHFLHDAARFGAPQDQDEVGGIVVIFRFVLEFGDDVSGLFKRDQSDEIVMSLAIVTFMLNMNTGIIFFENQKPN